MKTPLFIKIHLPDNKPYDMQRVVKPYFVVPWHFHPEIEIMLVTSGKGTRFVADSIEYFEPYDLVMLGPNVAHVWKNSQEHYQEGSKLTAECIYTVFTEESFGKHFFNIPEMSKVKQLFSKAGRGIKFEGASKLRIVEKILTSYNQTGVDQFISLMGILNDMADCEEYSYLSTVGYDQKVQASDMHRLNGVLDFMMKNFRNEIKLDQVASIASMSPTSFCRYFKSRTNKTVIQFLNEIRIGHAHKLLIETQYNMDQVSAESGYKNVSNFYEQFQKITGKSPHKFRKEHNESFILPSPHGIDRF